MNHHADGREHILLKLEESMAQYSVHQLTLLDRYFRILLVNWVGVLIWLGMSAWESISPDLSMIPISLFYIMGMIRIFQLYQQIKTLRRLNPREFLTSYLSQLVSYYNKCKDRTRMPHPLILTALISGCVSQYFFLTIYQASLICIPFLVIGGIDYLFHKKYVLTRLEYLLAGPPDYPSASSSK